MESMFVTDEVSHADTSPVKLDDSRNMYSMLVTDDVSHADTSLAKLDED